MRTHSITLFFALPLFTAFFMSVFHGLKRRVYEILSVAVLSALTAMAVLFFARGEKIVYAFGGWAAPYGIVWVGDPLSYLMLLVINTVAFLAIVYSIGYMKKYTAPGKYYTLMLVLIASMNGIVLSGDLFNIFVFVEIASISSYILVAYGLDKDELEAAFKYIILGGLASAFILLGIAIMYSITGTLNLADINIQIQKGASGMVVSFVVVLFLVGFGLKAALMPFHAWLPDAHSSAPAPVSAVLSGVVIKVLGAYALIRILYNVIGMNVALATTLTTLGTVSMIAGVLLALGQWDFKRLLAYSSISQMGYIIFALGLGTPLGLIGGIFHLVNHSISKSLLFLNAGAVDYSTGARELKQMGGLGEKMPVTSATSLIASFSVAGLPPSNGFWSKLIIIIAAFQARHYWGGAIAAATSIMTLSLFLKVQKYAFWGKLKDELSSVKEAPFSMKFSMVALAAICILLGVLYPVVRSSLIAPAAEVLGSGLAYASEIIK